MRADLGEPAFRSVCEAVEHRPRDRELEHAVAEELEPLVRLRAILRPRRVGEDLLEPSGGKLVDQATELIRPGFVRPSPGAR
jgi:hypothetical protein